MNMTTITNTRDRMTAHLYVYNKGKVRKERDG